MKNFGIIMYIKRLKTWLQSKYFDMIFHLKAAQNVIAELWKRFWHDSSF